MVPIIRRICITLSFTLAGCAGTQHAISATPGANTELSPETAYHAASYYVDAMAMGTPVQHTLLLGSESLVRGGHYAQADSILMRLNPASFNPSERALYHYLSARIAWYHRDEKSATKHIKLTEQNELPRDRQWAFLTLKHDLLLAKRALPEALAIQVQQLQLESNPQIQTQLSQLIWESCHQLSEKTLQSQKGIPEDLKGWFALNSVARAQGDFSLALHRWQQLYPKHSARKQMLSPGFQGILAPKKIALLLPLTGDFSAEANAVQTGFLSAYYAHTDEHPELMVFDTNQINVTQAYQKAVEGGAEQIIGPLTKEAVTELMDQSPSDLSIPTLALNKSKKLHKRQPNVVTFSLAAEEETTALAKRLFESGHHHVAILSVQSNIGKRLSESFINEWSLLGGMIPSSVYYEKENDPALYVRQLLGIDASQERLTQLRRLIYRKIVFQPRRRQDIDAIVLLSPPEEARQLRPLLDFYYADDLPVYAASYIYQGYEMPKLDRDINSVEFCDMPVILDKTHPDQAMFQHLIAEHPHASPSIIRLWALGLDAYRVSMNFDRIRYFPQLGYPGATGTLYLDEQNNISRQLKWATMTTGKPKLLF